MWCNGSTHALGVCSPSSNLGIPTLTESFSAGLREDLASVRRVIRLDVPSDDGSNPASPIKFNNITFL